MELEGEYRLDRLIGRGGTGEVHAATRRRSGGAVAIKLFDRTLFSSARARRRWELAISMMASLQHRAIVATYDFGFLSDGTPWQVMELLNGRTLRQLLHDVGYLELSEALSIAQQVAGALDAAHCAGVVHGDLSPSNIIVKHDADGSLSCKVIDFGIPGPASGKSRFGTPGYLAPEQRSFAVVDPRSDIYALGLILSEVVPDPPQRFGQLVSKALQSDPEARHPTAAAFLCEVESLEFEQYFAVDTRIAGSFPPPRSRGYDERTVEIADNGLLDQTVQIPRPTSRYIAFASAALVLVVCAAGWQAQHHVKGAAPVPTAAAVAQQIPSRTIAVGLGPPASAILPVTQAVDEETAARSTLQTAVNHWLTFTHQRNFDKQLEFYPQTLEAFYLWRNVSRAAVVAEKRRVFGNADIIEISIGTPQITFDVQGHRARMRFSKRYTIKGSRIDRHGEVLQELLWMKLDSDWKIVSERDLRVIS